VLEIRTKKKTIRGSLARQLLRLASYIPEVNGHSQVNFGRLYTTVLSETFRFPKGVRAEKIVYKTAVMEKLVYSGSAKRHLIIQFHGGAYVSGYSDTYRRSALRYLRFFPDTCVISLDYRLAPEHPFPAALEDAFATYEYALNVGYTPDKIIFVGDSAGGGLALALGLKLRDQGMRLPKAIVTMSAWTDLAAEGESYLRNRHLDPLLGDKSQPLDVYAYVRNNDIYNPYISPAYGDYHDFTDLMMHVGSYEVLESDTITVAKKAYRAGNKVDVTIYNGMFHVFQLAFGLIPEAKKAWKEIKTFIAAEFSGDVQ